MWRTTITLCEATKQEYDFFHKDLFQKSVLTGKSIIVSYKLQNFKVRRDTLESDKEKLLRLSQAIVGHQAIVQFINERLYSKLPGEDPLLLREQLIQIEPELQSLTAFSEEFFHDIEAVSTSAELAAVLENGRVGLARGTEVLNNYNNLQAQVQSVIFSQLKNSLLQTMRKLNYFIYLLGVLFFLYLFFIYIHFQGHRRNQEALAASYSMLEERVEERTKDLTRSKQELENEIRERKQVEYELRLKTHALENSLNGFSIFNEKLQFIYANSAYLQMWRYGSLDEISSTSLCEHCKDETVPQRVVERLREDGKCILECTAKRQDNSFFEVLMYATLSHDEAGREIYPTTYIDISERKKAEKERRHLENQLQQARKMEAVGTLSGGIAHEFNNVLGIILGNVELAVDDVNEKDIVSDSLKEIKNAAFRARDVVQQLLSFSRETPESFKVLDVVTLIERAVRLLRASIPSNIAIDLHIEQQCKNIIGDPTQFHQIIINLCNNAVHAMEENGGILRLELMNETFVQPVEFREKSLEEGDYVVLRIIDTGCGIEKDALERIFDPFYTTKEVGQGSGMGLSVVHGIVASHNGGILAKSSIEEGTCIEAYFPATDREHLPVVEENIYVTGGTEHLLLVDDEYHLVRLGSQVLERLGYKVTTFMNPLEALATFKQAPEMYQLVISDMTMPNMTGDILVEEIRKINPGQRVILCSGYSKRLNTRRIMELGVEGFIMKPFGSKDLAEMVRGVLDKPDKN